jgi:putative addiction module component (TIGR02574 family)
MTQNTEAIFQAALAMPPENRAALADKLLESLGPEDQEEVDEAWEQEIERRVTAWEEGKLKTYPAEEVLRPYLSDGKNGNPLH